ncbi:MAG: hypothetical protein JRH01_09225 [Deltaproteobacteria bacterium]|nr:hypothetical protein [Deltaproteobacteria bacterium]MBW2393128.1 hypothetical protein [Deltaproteobacteria bacterium]
MRRWLLVAAVCAGLAASAWAEEGVGTWEQMREEQGITISRLNAGGNQPAFRGVVVMEAELVELLAVLSDDARRVEWMARCIESRRLDERPDGSMLIYSRTKGRWPVSDRDSVLESTVTVSPAEDRALIELRAAESPLMPPISGVVRIPEMEGHYLLEVVSPGRTQVEYQLSLSLGGSVPGFVSAFVEEDLPFDTLNALREQVKATRGQYGAEILAIRHRLPSVASPPPVGAGF